MKKLIVTFGASGSGKSLWVNKEGFKQYAIEFESLKKMYNPPRLTPSGEKLDESKDKTIWKNIFEILEKRMRDGEFTVVDANNIDLKRFFRFKQLCRQYNYELILSDFSNVTIEEIKRRRSSFGTNIKVSSEELELQYEKMDKIRSSVHDVCDSIAGKDLLMEMDEDLWHDLSSYKKVHHIGDIHGCYEALMTYLIGGKIKEDEAYIFVGDYTDRGTQSAEVVEFLIKLRNMPNVFFLMGNHDIRLERFSRGRSTTQSHQFNKTRAELNAFINKDRIGLKDMADWTSKFKDAMFYKYLDKEVYVTHGGLSRVPLFLNGIASRDLINGVGSRKFDVDNAFQDYVNQDEESKGNKIQIHGHRNRFNLPVTFNPNSINLEGKVEFGEFLRVCTIEQDEKQEVVVAEHLINNRNYYPFYKKADFTNYYIDVDDMVEQFQEAGVEMLKDDKNRTAYSVDGEDLSDEIKNIQTVVIDENKSVCHRTYDSIYPINETEETHLVSLAEDLVFPVTTYNKYDGIAVSYSVDDVSVKSDIYDARDIKSLFKDRFNTNQMNFMRKFIKKNNVTLQFELILDLRADSVVMYGKDDFEIILLDAVKNAVRFDTLPEMDVHEFIGKFNELGKMGILFKQLAISIPTWGSFMRVYRDIKADYGTFKGEGYIFEDARGFRFSIDTNWYKMLESIHCGIRNVGVPLKFNDEWFPDTPVATIQNLSKVYSKLCIDTKNVY